MSCSNTSSHQCRCSCCEPTGPLGIPEQLLNADPGQGFPVITQQVACGPCGSELINLRYLREFTTPCGTYRLFLEITWDPEFFSGVGDTVYFYYTVTNTGTATIVGDIEILDSHLGSFTIPEAALNPGGYVNIRRSYDITQQDADAHIITTRAIAAVKVPCYPVVVVSNVSQASIPQGTVSLSGVMTQELLVPGLITVLAKVAITNSCLSHVAAENVRLVFPIPQYVNKVFPRAPVPPASAIIYDVVNNQVIIEIDSLPICATYHFEWDWFSLPADKFQPVTWTGTITTTSLPVVGDDLTVTNTWILPPG